MAKRSLIAKQRQRERIVAAYAERRAAYRHDSVDPRLPPEARAEAMRRLHALPRDASPTRLRNRDAIDGRPRAFNRRFGLSRINLRDKAHRGELPGVVKSS
ncbi:30S ribosomal protein S14 [Bifidobacterium thermacidophilum]|jgi:small subunit ribosomal protein S14|uniref:Small ribosomal subunit protein uS14 n=1 Tax=Bifidobacterium thermacidophilum subsp. thermacidophilum TaxID=79262 RepID=A0A087E2F4_9BIFI|nr:30S ribosomal protein S14 [Bifidobacterium thermacidophilum]KFJ01955.1 30S ribosomal protein S14 [Bifidobacterium thermacidophilum subsp. thermacidophilum]